ncbi:DUF4876 domain-containing protein [Niabella beijingensis]|uniref:DUF4876 domain-containing protein n=1 Tax=Niabella beijingensis TaxID=2872700 RepID=UPI001CC12365|nr:DUF4876 domain-containing protein [Niabella beijingensis]MBZ4191256.1 DUF4876 domain-containing protein [Niabella beijingensis]
MKRQSLKWLFIFSLFSIWVAGCKKDDTNYNPLAPTAISFNNPEGVTNAEITSGSLKIREINSGRESVISTFSQGKMSADLTPGSYEFSFTGAIKYDKDGSSLTAHVKAFKDQVVIREATEAAVALDLFLVNASEGFVIQEIFFTGTRTPEDKTYNGDKYIIIHNNSDKVLYADSLIVAESHFLTTTKRDYTPDVMKDAFTSSSIYMIPGNGKTYPIEPGASFTIAENAINHLEFNSNSMDLSNAKFEVDLIPTLNVDNPAVPNTIRVFGNGTPMHNRGFKSYVLAKLDVSLDAFKQNNLYTASYTNSAGGQTAAQVYRINNNTILDAVNLSVAAEFNWIVTAPSIDMGWSHCGAIDGDPQRYGKSVIRKVLSTGEGGRVILKDDNNSTEDFTADARASLLK